MANGPIWSKRTRIQAWDSKIKILEYVIDNISAGTEELEEPDPGPVPDIANPEPLHTGTYTPELTEASAILDERQCNALAAAVPIRHRWRRWKLAYSTARDGVSLRTLFR